MAQKRHSWLRWLSGKVAAAWPDEPQQVHMAAEQESAVSGAFLRENICTTLALYTFYWLAMDI